MSRFLSQTVLNSAKYVGLLARHMWDPKGHNLPRLDYGQTHAVLVIPGFLGPRSVTKPLQLRFERDGFPAFGFNLGLYSTLTLEIILRAFARRIQTVRRRCPQLTDLSLVGHSMGGIIAAAAIERGLLDDFNPRLVGLGSPYRGTHAAWIGCFIPGASELLPFRERYHNFERLDRLRHVPFLSLAGEYDVLAPPERCVHPWATSNEVMSGVDHAGLLLSEDVYARAAAFLKTR